MIENTSNEPVVLPPGPRNLVTGMPVSPFENAYGEVNLADLQRWRVQIGDEALREAAKRGYVISEGPWQEMSTP